MKLRKAATLIILGILHIVILLPKALSSGVFELRLTSFSNDRGLDNNGNCCNGVTDSSNPAAGPVCTEKCHTFFTICLTNYMSDIPEDLSKEKCLFGYVNTDVLGYNNVDFGNIDGFNNVIVFHFNISWPRTFSIIIESWHDATLSNPVTGSPRELISRLAAQRQLQISDEWKNFKHKTPISELDYQYRVKCDKDYYGPGCSNLCRPRDDQFGHYTCSSEGDMVCMSGWRGSYCDQAICLEGCEAEHGYCDRPYECKCRVGWTGPLCKDCQVYPGCQNGSCVKPWQCNCYEGWGGLFCNQDLNYCTHHTPCENGGVCQNSGSGSYTCSCPEGYEGTNCERRIDNCIDMPCKNGGTCKNEGGGFVCKCPPSYTGKRCDNLTESCEKNPCKNGATCVEGTGTSYECLCKAGYTGRNCDGDIYDCDPNPCQNNGRCVDELNGFKCVCETGFSGLFCETNNDDCSHNPCRNGGTCMDLVNDFECRCIPGFLGELCETNVDDCELRPCANGGSCKDLVNDFECTCRPGFTGKFCTIDINECLSNPCRNGGNCTEMVDDYHCKCPPGFTGKNCQYIPGQMVTSDRTQYPTDVTTTKPAGDGKGNHTKTVTEQQGAADDDDAANEQLLLGVCLGTGIPLILIIIVVAALLCRRRRGPDTKREEEENAQNSINNKIRESKIFTTLPHSSSTISNFTSKISNEDSDYNTLKQAYRCSSRPSSQIFVGDKPINKQLVYTTDLQVHSKTRNFEKVTSAFEKEKGSIDPSNFVGRESQLSPDIEKPINRDKTNRNSVLILNNHQEPHRPSSFYGDDVIATEV